MRNDNDRLSVRNQVLHDREELVDLLLCQDRGGLVEDQDLRSAVQRFEDLHTLLHADGDIPDQRVRIDVQAVFLNDVQHVLSRLFHVERNAALGRFHAQNDVLRHGEILYQHEVLVHHTYTVLNCGGRILDLHLLAANIDFSLICLVQAVQDIHQRTLTGAVLSQDRVDRPLLHVEIDVGQRIE